jgi:hypothetical protein
MKRSALNKRDFSVRRLNFRKCETQFSKIYDLALLTAALLIIFLLPN